MTVPHGLQRAGALAWSPGQALMEWRKLNAKPEASPAFDG